MWQAPSRVIIQARVSCHMDPTKADAQKSAWIACVRLACPSSTAIWSNSDFNCSRPNRLLRPPATRTQATTAHTGVVPTANAIHRKELPNKLRIATSIVIIMRINTALLSKQIHPMTSVQTRLTTMTTTRIGRTSRHQIARRRIS